MSYFIALKTFQNQRITQSVLEPSVVIDELVIDGSDNKPMTPSMRQSQYIDQSKVEAEITGDESSGTSHDGRDSFQSRYRARHSRVGEDGEFRRLAETCRNLRATGLSGGGFLTRSPLHGDPIGHTVSLYPSARFLQPA